MKSCSSTAIWPRPMKKLIFMEISDPFASSPYLMFALKAYVSICVKISYT